MRLVMGMAMPAAGAAFGFRGRGDAAAQLRRGHRLPLGQITDRAVGIVNVGPAVRPVIVSMLVTVVVAMVMKMLMAVVVAVFVVMFVAVVMAAAAGAGLYFADFIVIVQNIVHERSLLNLTLI
jgi:hypothetical protein